MTTAQIKKVSLSVLKRLANEHLILIGKKKYPYIHNGHKYVQRDIIQMFRKMPMYIMKQNNTSGKYVMNPIFLNDKEKANLKKLTNGKK